MSLRDWWDAVRDIFGKPPSKPKPRFVPPHSLPDSELPPKWPEKKDRK